MTRFIRLLSSPALWGLLACFVLIPLLAPWAYPEPSTLFLTQTLGIWDTGAPVSYPLITLLFKGLRFLIPTSHIALSVNLLTALIAAGCVVLLSATVRNLFRILTLEPESQPALPRVERVVVPLTACALLLSPVFLRSGTHFTVQIIDLFLLLAISFLFFRVTTSGSTLRMGIVAFFLGVLLPESPVTLVTVPVLAILLFGGYMSTKDLLNVPPFLKGFFFPLAGGAAMTLLTVGSLAVNNHAATGLLIPIAQYVKQLLLSLAQLAAALPWILILFVGLVPALLLFLLTRDVCKNKRSGVILFVLIVLTLLAVCAFLPTPLALVRLTDGTNGLHPVLFAALTAFAIGCSSGCLVLLRAVRLPPEAVDEPAGLRRISRALASVLLPVLIVATLAGGIVHSLKHLRADARLAHLPKHYVETILDNMDKATWILSDGVADPLLALRLAERKLPVTLFSLTQDHRDETLEALRKLVETEAPFNLNPALQTQLGRALDIGLIPFIQDWMRSDSSALDHFVTLALPDLWFTGNCLPLPDTLWYRGVPDRETLLQKLPATGAQELFPNELLTASDDTSPALKEFAAYLRRQVGFVSNNLAFFLADAGKKEEAFALFNETYAYDPDNVSALFNIFELIHDGLHEEKQAWCEAEIQKLIKTLSGRKYRLWSLARTYGYIRSPQLISALAGNWAMSGQTGAALSGMDLALEMLDDGQRAALKGSIAALYTMTPGKRQEAIALYKELLGKSTDTRQSLTYLRELIRMTILEGDLAAAEALLVQAESLAGEAEMGYERALYASTAGDPTRARIALQGFLERNPKHIDALAMLATLQMSMEEFEAVHTSTLPKLLTAAGTEDNYFVQIILARLAEVNKDLKKARAAYLRALALKPEVTILRTTILTLDIRLNDRAAAEQHAKRFLYQDRNLPLANYIMGALSLQDDDLKRAESYLLIATDRSVSPPIPEAFNDLAETYRRAGKWAPALATARQAYAYAPKLACAHETAAAALLEMNRYSEAEEELLKAIELDKAINPAGERDPSILLTQARLQEKQNQPELARVTLTTLRKHYGKLSKQGKAQFDDLAARLR